MGGGLVRLVCVAARLAALVGGGYFRAFRTPRALEGGSGVGEAVGRDTEAESGEAGR